MAASTSSAAAAVAGDRVSTRRTGYHGAECGSDSAGNRRFTQRTGTNRLSCFIIAGAAR